MNADNFEDTEYYFKQALKLIVYCYTKIKIDRKKKPYSRTKIHKIIKHIKGSEYAHNDIEDYLRNDLIRNLKDFQEQFNLNFFLINAGVEVSKENVPIGIVDIQFSSCSAVSLGEPTYIFECKRLNKYRKYLTSYIYEGMKRFITRKYYAEYYVPFAGMIAFVEVDFNKKPNGFKQINEIKIDIENLIKTDDTLNLLEEFSYYPLNDENYLELSNFEFSYISKHKRQGDNLLINIHHLFLDYYDIII